MSNGINHYFAKTQNSPVVQVASVAVQGCSVLLNSRHWPGRLSDASKEKED
jgi:hypothetical protein